MVRGWSPRDPSTPRPSSIIRAFMLYALRSGRQGFDSLVIAISYFENRCAGFLLFEFSALADSVDLGPSCSNEEPPVNRRIATLRKPFTIGFPRVYRRSERERNRDSSRQRSE